ncbi:MAG: hypothetical protein M3P37_10690 [Actinomycetota bacterium]|nr:hypothetical protein [Actinomycetota bacterium]
MLTAETPELLAAPSPVHDLDPTFWLLVRNCGEVIGLRSGRIMTRINGIDPERADKLIRAVL